MNDATLTEVDPFNPTALDEETELRALVRALEYSEGFKLIFVRCNQPQQRERLADELQKRLPQLKIQKIHFCEPVPHLLDALRERLATTTQDAVFVSGIEYSLPVAAEAHATPFAANLNASRNSFPQVVNCPLVLWLPEYVLNAITIAAPDFFSIRSGVYSFAATFDEAIIAASGLVTGDDLGMADLTLAEKQERIVTILSLLADYEALCSDRSNDRIKAQLHLRLGRLFFYISDYDQAQRHYQHTLQLAEELHDPLLQGIAVSNLGGLYMERGQFDKAEESYRRGLKIFDEIDQQLYVGVCLTGLGILYRRRGELEEAEAHLRRSLMIFHQTKDRVSEAGVLTALGTTFLQKRDLDEAEKCFIRSLAISTEIGSLTTKGGSLDGLGAVYQLQGRLAEAEESFQQTLTIYRGLGNASEEADILFSLGLIYIQQRLLTQAEKYFQESLVVYRRMHDHDGERAVLQFLAAILDKQKGENSKMKERE